MNISQLIGFFAGKDEDAEIAGGLFTGVGMGGGVDDGDGTLFAISGCLCGFAS
jgi:hypothetical protein